MFSAIFSIIALVMVFSLRGRIIKLEKTIKEKSLADGVEDDKVSSVSTNASASEPKPSNVSDELVSYIKTQLTTGVSEEDVSSALRGNNWDDLSIKTAIAEAKKSGSSVAEIENQSIVDTDSKTEKQTQWSEVLLDWLMEDWLMKLGAFLVLIGFGWFVNFAFANNWIGPVGRITLGLLSGVAILLLGEWRIKSFKNQGAVLLALGTAIIISTTIAGRELYGFFGGFSALAISFLSIVFIAASSVRHDSKALATLALVLGTTIHTLVLDVSMIDNVVWRFSYLFVVSLGTLWVVAIRGWKNLVPLSLFLITLLNADSFFYTTSENKDAMLYISLAFVALYFTANIIGILKSNKASKMDVVTAGGVGAFSMLWILTTVSVEMQSIITTLVALIFAVASFVIFKSTDKPKPAIMYSGIAIAMLGAATAMELSGPTLTLAYIFEITTLIIVASFVLNNMGRAQKLGVLFAVPVFFSFQSIVSSSWAIGVLHGDFFVLLSLALALLFLGYFFHINRDVQNAPSKEWTMSFTTFGSVYSLVLVWLVSHSMIENADTATALSLVIYTILGVILYIQGNVAKLDSLRVFGSFLLGAVVLRMLFVEVWKMALTGRIITFVLIGILLISTAFIGRKKE